VKFGLPFKGYKWIWLHKQPTEGLLQPKVLFGVLNACNEHEGKPKNSNNFFKTLQKVEKETDTKVKLARTKDRNLLRNSQQIWTSLFLLKPERQTIRLTKIAKQICLRRLSKQKYAEYVINNTFLPNSLYGKESSKWEKNNLKIRPLKIIVQVFKQIGKIEKSNFPALSLFETQRIIVPLSGLRKSPSYIAKQILRARKNKKHIQTFPRFETRLHDLRYIRSFLYFLSYFKIIERIEPIKKGVYWYVMPKMNSENLNLKQFEAESSALEELKRKAFEFESNRKCKKRKKTYRGTSQRDSRFKKNAMIAYGRQCLVTRETLPLVLEAAHIKPVGEKGPDSAVNSIILRKDIHLLYDKNLIRIKSTGHLIKDEQLKQSPYYKTLPPRVKIPFADRFFFNWREKYFW
jgi:hypothetical protein